MAATRWGIVGAGRISFDFVNALKLLPAENHQVAAVGARSLSKAEAFAKDFNIQRVYGSVRELAADPDLDIMYVGTIHPSHFEVCKILIEAGKNILCEKPVTMNVEEAERLIALAKEKNVFFMEGFWSRFFPMYHKLREAITAGEIGEIKMVQINSGGRVADLGIERLLKKELGAGGILDIGCYAVQFSLLVFGEEPEKIVTSGIVKNGIDQASFTTLHFSGGRVAQLNVHIDLPLNQTAIIFGSDGMITMPNYGNPDKLITPKETYEEPLPKAPKPMNYIRSEGLIYEAEAVRNSLLKGEKENPLMTHRNSLDIMKILDEMRRQLGVVYDADKE